MKIYNKIQLIINNISADNVFVYAAQASFYIITSSIPFIMLLLSLAQYFLPINRQDFTSLVVPLVPEVIKPSVEVIISEIFYKASGSVISITAITSIWSASRGIAAIERGIRNVYHTPTRHIFLLDIAASFIYTIIFLLVIIFFLLTVVFGTSIMQLLQVKSELLYWIFEKTSRIKWTLIIFLLTFFFSLIYAAFSGKKIHFKEHLPGAIFTTVIWIIFSVLYSFYIENFANYSYLYGSLTAIVLLMLWIYSCMVIFLLGGELNVLLLVYKPKKRDW